MKKEHVLSVLSEVRRRRTEDFYQEVFDKWEAFIHEQEDFDHQNFMRYVETFVSGKLGGRPMFINTCIEFFKNELRAKRKSLKQASNG